MSVKQIWRLSPESLAEAAAIAAYVSGTDILPTLDSIETGLDDELATAAVLAVAEHVCELRRWVGGPGGDVFSSH